MAWSLVVAPLLCSPLVPNLDLPGLVSKAQTLYLIYTNMNTTYT